MSAADAPSIAVADGTLRFAGPLRRDAVAALRARLPAALADVRRIDLTAADSIDSAGLALVSLVAARCAAGVAIDGRPAGFDELRAAYRLGDDLGFVRD
ncbi:MAG: STAS domain-containing protein [Lysobacteraceae bacterium]